MVAEVICRCQNYSELVLRRCLANSYMSYRFKTSYLNDSVFNSYPYWIAHYYVDSVEYKGEWQFWQHHDAGTLPGIDKRVDLNVFNGTLKQLDSLLIK